MSEPQLQSLTRPSTRFELGVLFRRMAGVAKMRREAFIDLKQDNSRITNLEAIAVVAIAGLSLGLGEALVFPLSALLMIAQLVTSIALALLVTASWSGLVYLIGTRIFKGSTDFPGMARPIFFSVTPGFLFVLSSIAEVRQFISPIIAGWIIIINVFALKHSMGFSNQKSLVTVTVGAWIMIFALGTLGLLSG
ncbi:hypothetical protein E6H23_02735 [Candidatus Bathyarchaeota archaeon]|nr:MAG: hypothetical protein E6H23_02735 [Candidatus Bathyarchaeota archaeon]